MRPKWKGPAAWAPREARAGDRLPYARHVNDATIALRDGSAMQVIHLSGLPFETEDTGQLDHMLALRDLLLRSALDSRFVVYHHVVRRPVEAGLDATFPNPFTALLDARWRQSLSAQRLFVNEQYLTILRRPPRGKLGLLERITRRSGDNQPDGGVLRELSAACDALLAGLSAYGARRLTRHGRISEPLALLSALYNGEWRQVACGSAPDLGHYLPYARVSFGLDAIETRRAGTRDFSAMLSLKDYPEATEAGMLDTLLRLPHALTITQTYAPADRTLARERMDLAIRRIRSADAEAFAERGQMMAARDALGMGSAGFGDHHLSVCIRADSLGALEQAAAAAQNALAEAGAIAVREDVNMEPAFWAQFPGNEAYAARRALISSTNAAGFLSLHGFPLGQAEGNHWGQAIALLPTTSATPYFFNFHGSDTGGADLGNFTVIGPSGSGKTVVLNFLIAQAQKHAPRTIVFDKDRGAEIFLRACGAHYARLTPGQPTGFNPLAMADSAPTRAFLRDFLACLLTAEGPEEAEVIAEAVDALFDHPPHLRRLRHLAELLAGRHRPQAGDLASRLAPWVQDGPHAWLFDHEQDRLDLSQRLLGFDMTALLDSPVLRTPAMMYLFHRIEERLDGQPTMICIDEGWKALDDPVFAARIRDWLKTLRKRNALVGFATQSARDALDSAISTALVEQTATMIFTPNARARTQDYADGFALTEQEVELIRALPASSRCFLVRRARESMVVRLDLSGHPDLLEVLSGREGSTRRLDALRAERGDHPSQWFEALTGTPWPEEAP
ncbi:VirB4 family type IV secretion/conjugal transfer ATPase [Novosphingobium umbonatum]|uniref:Type IV secretion system protein virB4 n=1 Tax=Novosphingobium umbonatum TaxID=1908524 RepID=A0A437NCP1_9SPHN|nr:VirB4 family type IV secretion/conjugal transfer ATPase [Novosphingobium umbonatum]RVU07572.1 VirB4 family type IV secretion/conjugal transfer ATPase [Novosphingobium umbonatum]